MEQPGIGRLTCAVALLLTLLSAAGCRTMMLESVTSCEDPNTGYWIARVTGDAKLQKVYGARIADREFTQRAKPQPGNTLHELRDYRKELLVPVNVRPSVSAQSADLKSLPPSEIMRVENYIASYESARLIEGAAYSREWAREMERIAAMMRKLELEVDDILRGARAELDKGNIDGALAALRQAAALDKDGPTVIAVEKQIRTAQAKHALPSLIAQTQDILKQVLAIQRDYFSSGKSSKAQLERCMRLMEQAETPVTDFRDNLRISNGEVIEPPDIAADIQKIEGDIATALGTCWKENVFLLSREKLFWNAYEYTQERTKQSDTFPEHRKTPLQTALWQGYAAIVPGGMSHYVNEANSHFANDAYGISLIFCRMAEELIAFTRSKSLTVSAEARQWEARCAASRKDAQDRIGEAIKRNVILREFTPQSVENQMLSTMVIEKLIRLVSGTDSNPAAWGVTVDNVQMLMPEATETL